MGVSENKGAPKKGCYNGKPYWNGWFGGKTHHFRKHPYTNMCILKQLFTSTSLSTSFEDPPFVWPHPPDSGSYGKLLPWYLAVWNPPKIAVRVGKKKSDPQVQTDSFRVELFRCSVWELKLFDYPSETLRSTLVQMAWNIKDIKVPPLMLARMGAWSAHRPFPWRGPQPSLQKS